MAEWLREHWEYVLLTAACALMVFALTWGAYLGRRAATETRDTERIARLEHTIARQRYELDRWRVLSGAELWAHEYTDVSVESEPTGGIDGAGREITEARAERSDAAVVYAMWRFDSRDEADDFLEHVGGLIDD